MMGAVVLVLGLVQGGSADRTMVVTVDDVPVSGPRWTGNDLAVVERINRQMINAFVRHGVPAMGFVNEARLGDGADRDARIDILRAWVGAGLDLGNHTFSHPDLNNTPLAAYQQDVLAGERVSRRVAEDAGRTYEFFRFPFTHTGPTREIRDALRGFLATHGYRHAPFTIENVDYAFNVLVADALARGDTTRLRRVREAYLDHTDRKVEYFEALSVETFGREIPQVLLIHVNLVNADATDEMLRRLTARGYRFITMDQALADPAFQTADDFVGRFGPSWLHRWRVALGLPARRDEPDPPSWVLEAYNRIIRR